MSAYDELLQFIEESRGRIIDVDANNRFGVFASALAEERASLEIIVSRYLAASEQLVRNTEEMMALNKPGTHPVSDEQSTLLVEAVKIQRGLRLEIRSYYLFAKILLDNVSRFIEFYFRPGRACSLDSHKELIKNLGNFCDKKGLSLPEKFLEIANDLKERISEYRDKQVGHDKSHDLIATSFSTVGDPAPRLTRGYIGPGPSKMKPTSEPLQDLTEALDEYLVLLVTFLSQNESKTWLLQTKS